MKNKNLSFMTQAAMIAAIYVVLTYIFAPFSFGEVQVRISEALTILPIFTPAAIPGLFVGCLIGNILGGAILPDIVFGSIATLIGAFFTWKLREQKPVVATFPPIISNIIIVPFVLRYGYGVTLPIPFMMLTVGIGEVISCTVLGLIVYGALKKYKKQNFFHTPFFIIHSVFSIIQYTYYRFRTSSDPSLHTSRCVLYCHSDLHTQHSYRCIPPE